LGQRRVAIGAFVDVEQRRQLVELARQEDRSVSAVVRRALAAELERNERPGMTA
jgi:post-segregation antitoxin (ccd killing protein)